jgi:integrase
MRKTLTDKGVAVLKARAQRYAFPDPELRGHYVRVQPSGAKSFVTVARDPVRKKQIWTVIAAADVMSIEDAREQAREVIKRVRAGKPALEAPPKAPDSFQTVAEQWLKRHVQKKALRTQYEIERLLNKHILPKWGKLTLADIRRSDVVALLDEVEDDHGARLADHVLGLVRSIMNWHAARTDDYNPPIVRSMRRESTAERARTRILNDDEIRVLWKLAEKNGQFGAFLRVALLTGQRREKIASMKWADIVDGTWRIASEAREKGNAGDLVLPGVVLDIINAQPKLGDNTHVFPAGRGNGPVRGFSHLKPAFDDALIRGGKAIPKWVVHDLRRTFRSLLSRAGVRPDIGERCMGHVQAGVLGTYDRHAYIAEKADALKRLAVLVDNIVHPRNNVRSMPERKRKRG